MNPILHLDRSGTPRQWIHPDIAICYIAKELVIWSLGDPIVLYHGGIQKNGERSTLSSPPIIATRGTDFDTHRHGRVALSNRALFSRDRNVCAYCGKQHKGHSTLSRDHVVPISRGGKNKWTNTVTACIPCNLRKDSHLLEECGMKLLYVPYEPSHVENLILQNRVILADQMEYLIAMVPKHSRIHDDLAEGRIGIQ